MGRGGYKKVRIFPHFPYKFRSAKIEKGVGGSQFPQGDEKKYCLYFLPFYIKTQKFL